MPVGSPVWYEGISIHALRKESDSRGRPLLSVASRFQSTLSVRRATAPPLFIHPPPTISIHALRKESDFQLARIAAHCRYFNPRSP